MAKKAFVQGELTDEQKQMRKDARAKVEAKLSEKDADFLGFLNVNLSDEEKAQFASWVSSAPVGELLTDLLDDGNVVSLKQDKKGKGYAAAITQRWAGSPNAGYCINMRADEPVKALTRMLFVVSVVLGEDWKESNALRGDSDW